MKKIGLLLFFLLSLNCRFFAQPTELISGVKLGALDDNSALILLDVTSNAKEITIDYWEKDGALKLKKQVFGINANKPVEVRLKNLKPGALYYYHIVLNGQVVGFGSTLKFRTKPMQVCKAGHF